MEISGNDVDSIQPIDRFKDAEMHPAILDNIERMKSPRSDGKGIRAPEFSVTRSSVIGLPDASTAA